MTNKDLSKTVLASLDKNKQKTASQAISAHRSQIRLPSQRPQPQTDSKKRHNTTQLVTKEWKPEVAHTTEVSSHLSTQPETPHDLPPKKIQRFHLKKTKDILQKMKELHEKAKGMGAFVVKNPKNKAKLEADQDEEWRDLMKSREERHFHIGRITNYFT